jgi:hypothetical protein
MVALGQPSFTRKGTKKKPNKGGKKSRKFHKNRATPQACPLAGSQGAQPE